MNLLSVAPMITIIPFRSPKTVAVRVTGSMLRPFGDEVIKTITANDNTAISKNIYVEARTFDDISVQALVRYLRFRLPESMRHAKKAIIAKPLTVDRWARSRTVQETFPESEVRLFTEQDRVKALQWTQC